MGVQVTRNRHGYLALRIFWRGRDEWVGSKLRDDGKSGRNRRRLEARAMLIAEKLADGHELHAALLAVLGDCPPRLMPEKQPTREIPTVRGYYESWIARRKSPLVRRSTITRNRIAFDNVLLPLIGSLRLDQVTPVTLLDLRASLLERKIAKKPIKLKTARNYIDWHFRSLYREAREIDGYPLGDPFALISWPESPRDDPDPFTVDERDQILQAFKTRRPFWHPFVAFQFFTGCRPSETAALRYGDIDLKAGTATIRISRSAGEEGATKTRASRRTIQLFPELLEILRQMPVPIEIDEKTYVFRNPEGNPITTQWWPRKSWYPVLRCIKVRVRKFYATRHTFITDLISRGEDMKAVAEYCGTSVAMIERSYGRWMPRGVDRGIRSLRALIGSDPDRNLSGTLVRRAVGDGLTHGGAGGKESGPTGNRTPVCDVRGRRPNR